MSGLFITFEGVEGGGKSTQATLLKDYLESQGCAVLQTREPGGTAIGEAIRGILLDPKHHGMAPAAELFLYEAARAQLVAERIRPALDAGNIVLCDRFFDSTTAYQGAGRAFVHETLEPLHALATGGLRPDLTLVLDLPIAEGLRRAARTGAPDRIEQEPLEFHERVREGFLALARREPDRVIIIDAARTVEEVAQDIRAIVDARRTAL